MALNLRIVVLIVALVLALAVYKILKKDLIPVKFSLLWWFGIIILVLLSIFPDIIVKLANLVGFQTISNLVAGVMIVILFFITMSLTVIVSTQKKKINLLIQEISILKSKLKD